MAGPAILATDSARLAVFGSVRVPMKPSGCAFSAAFRLALSARPWILWALRAAFFSERASPLPLLLFLPNITHLPSWHISPAEPRSRRAPGEVCTA
jgi:hypothetical protein